MSTPKAVGSLDVVNVISKPWDNNQLETVLSDAIEEYQSRSDAERISLLSPITEVGPAILIVNAEQDSRAHQRSLLATVEGAAYTCRSADSIAQAIESIEADSYDAILIDPQLADARGYHAIASVHAAASDIPLIAIGASDDDEFAVSVVQARAQDYIPRFVLSAPALHRAIGYAIERKRTEQKLTHLAHHDPLTQLANRSLLDERLEQALIRARRRNSMVAVFYLDLDRFKSINDTLGHHCGDTLLADVARRLVGSVRESDTVAGLGGDEFAILLEELHGANEATRLAQRVLNSFATPFRLRGQGINATTSIGIAVYPENGETPTALLKSAVSAMYRAKEIGRNNYQYFSNELHQKAVRRFELETSLGNAIKKRQFTLYLQPQLGLQVGNIECVEALLRWRRDDGSVYYPDEFLEILDETGISAEVGYWTVEQASLLWPRLVDEFGAAPRIAINISPRLLDDPHFATSVNAIFDKHDVKGSNFEFEVSEKSVMADPERVSEMLTHLSQLGIVLTIDNFGTSYSSVSYLPRFPVQRLKLDSSLMADVEHDSDARAIAAALLGDDQQLRFAVEHGCASAQG